MHSSDHNTDPSFPIPSNFRQSTVEPQYNEMPREQYNYIVISKIHYIETLDITIWP